MRAVLPVLILPHQSGRTRPSRSPGTILIPDPRVANGFLPMSRSSHTLRLLGRQGAHVGLRRSCTVARRVEVTGCTTAGADKGTVS